MTVTPCDPPYSKPHAACKQHSSMFDRTGVIAGRSFTLLESEFSTFLPPVTLTLTRWPSYTKLTVVREDMPHVQIWTSYTSRLSKFIVWQTYRHTDRHDDQNYTHAASRVAKIIRYIRVDARTVDLCRRRHWRMAAAMTTWSSLAHSVLSRCFSSPRSVMRILNTFSCNIPHTL